jgi:hypothetical protein
MAVTLGREVFAPQRPAIQEILGMVPITIGVPLVSVAVPPAVILIPTMLALVVEFAAAGIGFWTVLAVFVDGSVQIGFGLFDGVLAPGMFVSVGAGRHGEQQKPRDRRRG